MAINIKFDLTNNPETPTLILANRNGNKLGQLDVNPESVELIDKFNEASEISFTVNKYLDGEITPLWDKLVDFKLVYCKEWDVWFECVIELDEATESVKTVFCTQLGQAELSQIMLYNIEINTEIDIERDDYKIGILYDPEDSQASILNRLLEKAPHYSIVHVDNTLENIQRSFSFDSTSVYDALQEIAEEIGCLFIFHSDSDANGMPQRTISVYDLQQNCRDCGYRGEFTDKCPKCESKNIKYGYGKDTLIFVTSDELASEGIQLVTDTDSVKNCFKLEAGDDLMTATVRNRNPNGTDYIWYFSDATKEDMPDILVEKIEAYDEKYKYYYNDYVSNLNSSLLSSYNSLVNKYSIYDKDNKLERISNPIVGFASLMQAYYNTIDLGWYLKSGLMPNVTMGKTSAREQASFLSSQLPPLIAVMSLKTVSKSTADSSILMMAKAIVNSNYKVSINSSSLSNNRWSGIFVIENYSDEDDSYTTGTISRSLTDYDETYIKQKIDKILSKENTDDLSITGLFEKNYDNFCAELKKYALNPLISFHDACQACLDILIEQGVGGTDSLGYTESGSEGNLYEKLYVPYYNKLKAIESEIKVREDEVNIVLGTYDVNGILLKEGLQTNIEDIKIQIQDELNFEKYLGRDLWLQFCAYRREDKYSNSNYISDGLNNAELFERALQFYEVAENEIFKSSELQHSISATLNNLLAIPKFRPLVESFEVGNWIRVQVDDFVYKLRLVQYEISYGDFNTISVKFSDVSKIKTGYSDLEDILSDASSMATSYDSIQRQANLGNEARNMIRQWLTEGLDASLIQIQNNTNEDIVIDNNGLIGRSYSDITEEYSPEQIRLTHNIIAFTDDNWESVTQAIGKHKHTYYDEGEKKFVDAVDYGMSANFVTAGFISGSQIIGGNIYSDNYSVSVIGETGSYIDLRKGEFSFGGGILKLEIDDKNKGKLTISSKEADSNLTEINEEWIRTTDVYAENLNVNAAKVSGKLTAAEIDAGKITSGTLKGRDIRGGSLFIEDEDGTSYAEITGDGVLNCNGANISGIIKASTIETSSLYVDGKYVDGKLVYTEIDSETGILSCNGANISGTIYANAGEIGGCIISDGLLQVPAARITGELEASILKGENVKIIGAVYDSYGNILYYNDGTMRTMEYGNIYVGRNKEGNSTVELDGYDGLRIFSSWGNVFLESCHGYDDYYDGTYNESKAHVLLQDGDVQLVHNVNVPNGSVNINNGNLILGNEYVDISNHSLYLNDGGNIYVSDGDIYVSGISITASDRNKKHDIEYDISKYDALFDDLKPVIFKYNNGTSDRYHTGLIANDVKDALVNNGLTTQDFAAYCEVPIHARKKNDNLENESEDYYCALRYGEFVSLNIYQIQQLKKRTLALEEQVNILTENLNKLNMGN